MAIDTKVTEEEIRKVYAEVVRGNVLSIVHRPSNRVVLQVVIYPQGDMAITHRFYMDLCKVSVEVLQRGVCGSVSE